MLLSISPPPNYFKYLKHEKLCSFAAGYHNLWVCCCHENPEWTSWTICRWRRAAKYAIFSNQLCCDSHEWKKFSWNELAVQRCLVYSSQNLHGSPGTTNFNCRTTSSWTHAITKRTLQPWKSLMFPILETKCPFSLFNLSKLPLKDCMSPYSSINI